MNIYKNIAEICTLEHLLFILLVADYSVFIGGKAGKPSEYLNKIALVAELVKRGYIRNLGIGVPYVILRFINSGLHDIVRQAHSCFFPEER